MTGSYVIDGLNNYGFLSVEVLVSTGIPEDHFVFSHKDSACVFVQNSVFLSYRYVKHRDVK